MKRLATRRRHFVLCANVFDGWVRVLGKTPVRPPLAHPPSTLPLAHRRPSPILTEESRLRGGFIPAETLVQNGTAGDNGTAGGILNQLVLGFLV